MAHIMQQQRVAAGVQQRPRSSAARPVCAPRPQVRVQKGSQIHPFAPACPMGGVGGRDRAAGAGPVPSPRPTGDAHGAHAGVRAHRARPDQPRHCPAPLTPTCALRPPPQLARGGSASSSGLVACGGPLACRAGKLDEVSLFADSSMLGPSSAAAAGAAAAAGGVESVELKSKVRGGRRAPPRPPACLLARAAPAITPLAGSAAGRRDAVQPARGGGGGCRPAPAFATRACKGRRPFGAAPSISQPGRSYSVHQPFPKPHLIENQQLGLDYAPLAQYLKEEDFRKVGGVDHG
jgi:hypothetical protein